jgi:hypothetical protein
VNTNPWPVLFDHFIKTSEGKTTFISNDFEGISDLENAEIARRWGNLT